MGIKINMRKIKATFFSLLLLACSIGEASAQLLDDILFEPAQNGKVAAIIKLNGPVELLQHFPEKQGQHLEIFFKILVDSTSTNDPWQGYEARTSPSSDLIPSFIVSARDMLTQPKLVIEFSRPAEYSVRIGKSRRSFVIYITPDKVKANSGKAEPVKEQPVTKNEAPVPQAPIVATGKVAAATVIAAVPVAAPSAAPTPAVAPVPAAKVVAVASTSAAAPTPVAAPAPETKVSATASTQTAAPIPVVPEAPVATEASAADQIKETDSQAEVLMVKGRDALKTSQYGMAIDSFNKVLLLPPNKYSQDAQELIGVAREEGGQKFKAQREYETYLKLYTSGEGVIRVKDRLAKLTAAEASRSAKAIQDVSQVASSGDKNKFQTVSSGSVSMNYYNGVNQTVVAGATSQAGPVTDQSMLITNVSASLRVRNDRYDNRLVVQDTYNKNFLATQLSASNSNPNRLGAAYYEFKDKVIDFSSRIGRQSPIGGGVMGRFDGISAGYGVTPNWQITSATGQLSDYASGSKPTFYSVGLGLKNGAHWGGGIYYVNQKTNGVTDRSSLGAEMRYFDVNKNAFSMLDYDTFFNVLNMALLQGSINGAPGTTYNFNLDHRRSPSISLSNALIGSPSTMQYLLTPSRLVESPVGSGIFVNVGGGGFTIDDLKALAILRTGTSDSASLGANTQIKEKWQAGADLNVSRSSGLPESGTNVPGSLDGYVPPTPSSGANYGINARLIGNSLFSTHDVSVFSVGYTSSALSKGENFTFSNHLSLAENWTLDSSFRLNWQSSYDSITGLVTGKVTTLSPAVRLNYQVKSNVSLEFDYGLDITDNIPTSGQSSKTTRNYFSLGGRWDF